MKSTVRFGIKKTRKRLVYQSPETLRMETSMQNVPTPALLKLSRSGNELCLVNEGLRQTPCISGLWMAHGQYLKISRIQVSEKHIY